MNPQFVDVRDIPEMVEMWKLQRETRIKNIQSKIDKEYNKLSELYEKLLFMSFHTDALRSSVVDKKEVK